MPIPEELKLYRQWVVWRRVLKSDGKITKLPYNPLTGILASVTEPNTWCDFETAAGACTVGGYDGIGFVLTRNDPYSVIDLDDPEGDPSISAAQLKIAQQFNSYGELSPSGMGLHIWLKGNVPVGRRRKKIEVYSCDRYLTVTGATFEPLNLPIAERQYLLEQLWNELGHIQGFVAETIVDQPEVYTDDHIYNMATCAENGEKFTALWRGEYQSYYNSQSEADLAIINIICFYSRNTEQVFRLFKASALGKRDKANRQAYVMHMIRKSFDNMPPVVDLTAISNQVKAQITSTDKANPFAGPLFENTPDDHYEWTLPPGLLGGIAEFIYQSSPRPVKEIALAGAIGLMAGICGRSYNVSGTGLNQYILILAPTGVGKEAATHGIDKLINIIEAGTMGPKITAIKEFVGPADIASGQALAKYLPTHPCFVSIVNEFGFTLKQLSMPNANGAEIKLRKMLLALYSKSGAGEALRPTIYSDKDQTTELVYSPSFSILGESIPDVFYESLNDAMVGQGLFPRFTCVEYLGKRVPTNKGHEKVLPNVQLVQDVSALVSACLAMNREGRVVNVAFDDEAQRLSDRFDVRCDALINGTDLEIIRQLWTRAHMKAMKLAALLAVGITFYEPVIDVQCMQWAIDLVQRDINNIMRRYDSGKVGMDTNEVSQIDEIKTTIAAYMMRPWDKTAQQCSITKEMYDARVITMSYLQKKLLGHKQFKNDRIGASNALKRAIQSFVTDGSLIKIPPAIAYTHYKKTAELLAIADSFRFMPNLGRQQEQQQSL